MSQENDPISQFDKKAVEKDLGFVKFDILGITTLEVIQNCLELIGKNIFDKYPDGDMMDDKRVYDLINSGNLTYIFQLDGWANRIAIRKIGGIHDFEDIVITTSVSRPGTSQFIPELAEAREGKKPKYPHKDLAPIMDSTYGVLLYQEQVMEIARKLAGFDMVQVDDIKEMIKGKDHAKFEAMLPVFEEGCIKKGYNQNQAEAFWKIVERASGYLYNRSHAVSYSVTTYQMAYLKTYYPLEFIVSCMNIRNANLPKIVSLVHEAPSMGIDILGPNIHKSDVNAIIEGNAVRLGLSLVKYVGVRTARQIVSARQSNGRRGILELPRRVMSKRVIESLKDVGAFGEEHKKEEREEELLGFQLRDPAYEFIQFIDDHTYSDEDGTCVFGGTITKVRKLKTKRGDDMAFVDMTYKGENETLALFPEQLYEFGDQIEINAVYLVKGKRQTGYDSVIPSKMRRLK